MVREMSGSLRKCKEFLDFSINVCTAWRHGSCRQAPVQIKKIAWLHGALGKFGVFVNQISVEGRIEE